MPTLVLPCPVANPSSSNPFQSIPMSQLLGSSKPLPLLPTHKRRHATAPISRPRPSSTYLSPMFTWTPVSLVSVLQEPRILANFLRYVRWDDFQSLVQTCAAYSHVLQHPNLRDVVLSAYVPGYSYCLHHADIDTRRSIAVQFSDLNHFSEYSTGHLHDMYDNDSLLVISQQLPLHHYPTDALATLSAQHEIEDLEEKIRKYVVLCQAHSRMVLLLQALIHSSSSPVPEELEDPSLRYRNATQQGGRELVFPAPLSFLSNDGDSRNHAPQKMSRGHTRFFSAPATPGRLRRKEADPPRRSLSRMSILGRNKVPLPPPSADPLSLKIYSGSWRGPRRTSMIPSPASDVQSLLRRTKLNFERTRDSSGSSTDNSRDSPSPNPTRLTELFPTLASHTPHDIRAAVSRLRAPVLRVYFPCSEMDHRAIAACEAQLEDAELWQHLSVGDIVCNLGYLPPVSAEVFVNEGDPSCDDTFDSESWMIFDGTNLMPYIPSAPLPLPEPLSLPSPFYYTHITSPPINPRFIATLPHGEPELSLVLLPVRVRSPHSPNGFARTKKYLWLARLPPHVRPGLGERWHCEWILEGEGTKEGRQFLLDALRGDARAEREWELVMERCTPSRIWLRSVLPSTVSNFGVLIHDFRLPVAGSCQTCFRLEFRLPVNGGIHLASVPPASSSCTHPFARTWNLPIFCLYQSINFLREYGRILNHYINYASFSPTTGPIRFSLLRSPITWLCIF